MRKEPRSWTPPAKLAIIAIRRGLAGLTMRRLVLLLCVLAAGALPAQAKALRFPPTGKHVFLVDLPKGWQTKTDARGGLLLIPPSQSQHAMIYLAILVDDKLRGQPVSAVAAQVAKEEPARMTDPQGAILRGTAFYGKISEKIPEQRGLARKAKIVIFPLEPNTWAQAWTCLLYTSPSPRDGLLSRMPSSA